MKTARERSHSLWDSASKILLGLIMAAATGVIAGWHLHVSFLITIFPGLIAMQYNTALCFIVLVAGGWLLIIESRRRSLVLLSGAVVSIMGAIVVFQYATGISLHVDTALFDPWNTTLVPFAGRMALTTAISFMASGVALIFLAWRRSTMAFFAIAHTLPLSLGLTSCLGYAFQITYVLPFYLGSQMALHTAIAFLIYGSVMISYSWRQSDWAGREFPTWSPGIAALLVPVLFVSIRSVTQSHSTLARASELLAAVAVSALFGLLIRKLIEAKVSYKGLILISIPLVFLLAFVALITQMKRASERDQAMSLHSKEVIAKTEMLLNNLVEAESSMRGFVITENVEFDEAYKNATRRLPRVMSEFLALIHDNAEQERRGHALKDIAARRLEQLEIVSRMMHAGDGAGATREVKGGNGSRLMQEFRAELAQFLAEEVRLDAARREALKESWQRFDWLLVAGTSTVILLAAMLAFLFTRGISSRLLTLTENAQRLAAGEELISPLKGSDEIARLDTVFHRMATEIREAARKERTEQKAIEAEISRARDAALESARLKAEFLANMSHEIRTPMNGVIGMTDLALETDLTPEQREYLSTAKLSADSLMSILNDILDFSKIEAGKLDIDSIDFNLRECLRNAMKTLAVRAHEKGLELTYRIPADVPEALIGDPGRLRQIVVNLVGNAIKFTEHGEIAVDVETLALSDGEASLHFKIKDTGIGISPSKQEIIFDAFAQGDGSTSRTYGGTGLGLAISSQLARMMGGFIRVESEEGKGSTFHLTVPFKRQMHAETDSFPVHVNTIGLPVLVVDDNATNRRILQETLASWHMKPTIASGGHEALDALKRSADAGEPFALALIDAQMPEMDGFSLAEHIKQNPKLSGSPILMMTSNSRRGDARRCRELGIDAYMIKPVSQSSLLDSINKVLNPSIFGSHKNVPQSDPTPRSAQALNVLLVEDNPVNQMLAVILLKKWGHAVTVAANGLEALEALDSATFDLILMDIQMPQMNGFEATSVIRERERETGQHIPIIAMTANAMKGDQEDCLEAGMDAYISKPIRSDELFRIIESSAKDSPGSGANGRPPAGGSLDREAILDSLDRDQELLQKVVGLFLRTYPKMLSDIRDAVARGDANGLSRAAHTLKGSGGLFMSAGATELARQLDMMGRGGDTDEAKELLALLEREMERIRPELSEIVAAESHEPDTLQGRK